MTKEYSKFYFDRDGFQASLEVVSNYIKLEILTGLPSKNKEALVTALENLIKKYRFVASSKKE